MGNRPSVFQRTPEERLEAIWNGRKVGLSPEPPAGHLRVKFYVEYEKDYDLAVTWSVLVADFPLEPSGEFNFARVKRKWALESCQAIDPVRLIPFESQRPDVLSAIAVKVLTEETRELLIYEPSPSERTLKIREKRMRVVRRYEASVENAQEAIVHKVDAVANCLSSRPFQRAGVVTTRSWPNTIRRSLQYSVPSPHYSLVLGAIIILIILGEYSKYVKLFFDFISVIHSQIFIFF
ncbi:hypothetical protein SERLA73DRAFT_178578 [Serpula lacrymans var. lacrymans S7.3]|uniref:Uncharacterized protein n=2 Tax=Serpula lacrymans var. lacrymans TaxID=341189 RepID=F8PS26_SERL3|nr:uncharacterized protein SERLADRAFT_463079 [Serpula lacrymans var. lacrymans S7.9]EGO00692.1 hypothetical protein SERLA73DRAFT_178578 [Serpula lacrymans var. lacrymans S7.3]EGO26245.1 hypothetical protein SERLADRAFT_463079 [Serpula lacrymans var. lacrymans S7.9]